jgi:MoaA/NifB/PqqE/SkfB family radical SAM enzyme
MTPAILHAALSNVSGISMVTFTGGEPSLAPEVIEEFINICIWRKLSFSGFYIVTNGKAHNGLGRFMKAVDRLYNLADEQSACCLAVSQDQYHKRLREVQWHRYEMKDDEGNSWGEYPSYFNRIERDHDIFEPLDEGRAHKNGMGWKQPDPQKPWVVEDRDGELHVRDDNGYVYIAANGNVASNCNLSFKKIDRESKGNVLQKPLSEIIESFSIKEEVANVG